MFGVRRKSAGRQPTAEIAERCLSIGLWENGGSDPDAVLCGRSNGSMDEADSGVWGSVNGKG